MASNANDPVQAIIEEELNYLFHVADVFTQNFNRSLRMLHESLRLEAYTDDKERFIRYMDDIVRAVVVFVHSTLETTVREIIRLGLKCDADVSYIPLAGEVSLPNRKQKFTLDDLSRHRGKSVSQVIDESIDQYLATLSFNSVKDITDAFTKIGFPQSTLGQYYQDLEEMIRRRHQIVHEGDRVRDQITPDLEPVRPERVQAWIRATQKFCEEVFNLAVEAVCFDRVSKRLEAIGTSISKEELANRVAVDFKVEGHY